MSGSRTGLVAIGLTVMAGCGGDAAPDVPGRVTFNDHVAPAVFTHCAPCHRPGEVAPLPLLS